MTPQPICVLCEHEAKRSRPPNKDEFYVECNICRNYFTDDLTDNGFIKNRSTEERAMISAFTRELFEYGAEPPKLHIFDDQEVEKIIERYKKKTIYEKLDRLIQYAEKNSSYFGENIHSKINSSRDYPITYSKNINEFENVFSQARNAGLLRSASRDHLALTWTGWQRADEIKETGILSTKCFIAMSCSEDMNAIYEHGIKEAVIELGYEPIFIEKEEHNEKICDLIIAEIRGCKFLIADVTGQRQNVYYEAGFAHGLNRNVIWTCRHDEIGRAHFDTRQYNHITWTNAEDLKKKLVNRIQATIL